MSFVTPTRPKARGQTILRINRIVVTFTIFNLAAPSYNLSGPWAFWFTFSGQLAFDKATSKNTWCNAAKTKSDSRHAKTHFHIRYTNATEGTGAN